MKPHVSTIDDHFISLLKDTLDFVPTRTSVIHAGQNNRLFQVANEDGQRIFVKSYFKDDRDRLNREFNAYNLLHTRGFTTIPEALMKDDISYCAAYSFEDGHTKAVNLFNDNDITQCVDFILDLESVDPASSKYPFKPTVMGCLSLSDYISNIRFRLEKFNQDISTHAARSNQLVDFASRRPLTEVVEHFINQATHGMSASALELSLDTSQARFNPGDFNPQNILFHADKNACFVDFEYFGWDDPARLVANFLQHDQTAELPDTLKNLFLSEYMSRTKLPQQQIDRLAIVIGLSEIEWLSIHLFAVTSTKLESRKFADVNFDLEEYVTKQITKAERRLELLSSRYKA